MKPFNLEQAKAGHPICTRDGREVVEFHHWESVNQEDTAVINAVIKGNSGYHARHAYTIDGSYMPHGSEHCLDLFMASTVVTRWINIYSTDVGLVDTGSYEYHNGGTLYGSYAAAAEQGTQCVNYICTSSVTFEV